MASNTSAGDEVWPELALAAWKDTYATCILKQIVGKIQAHADAAAQSASLT
jgi:hypothetical protein